MPRPRKTTDRQAVILLLASQKGFSIRQIAQAFDLAQSTVYRAIERARRAGLPDLEILAPLLLTRRSACSHKAIAVGDLVYCIQCHQTGIEGHPLLRRNPRTDPKPDPKPREADGLAGGKGQGKGQRKLKGGK